MHCKQTDCPYEVSLQETEDGYAIHVKGDKEKLKAKLEAMEAFHNFHVKAKAAGWSHGHGNGHGHGHGHHGIFSLIHKHIQAVHKAKINCKEDKAAE